MWPNHVFNEAARSRMEKHRGKWATCAITELGFIRISSSPAALATPVSPLQASQFLSLATSDRQHIYLDGGPPPSKCAWDAVHGHKQVTDAWLIAFAIKHEARLLTFDTRLRGLSDGSHVEILRPDV